MPPVRFVPYREIASEVASRLAAVRHGADALTEWPEEVIVPSRGAAESMTAELLARMPNGVAGVQLQSLETLATRILNANGQMPRIATEEERRLAMRIAVRGIDDPVMSSRGIAPMLERAYRDLRDSGSTLADFTRRAGSAGARLRNARRTDLVIRAWTEYEKLIAQLGAVDPADLFLRATRLTGASVKPQLLGGFYDMTGAQRMLIEALLRAGRVAAIWIPTELGFAQPFIRAIASQSEVVREPVPAKRQPRMEVKAHDTRLEELRDVCRRVAKLLSDGVPAREIGIVARSFEPYDARLLNRFAKELGFRTTLDEEVPLAAHRIGRGALMLLRLREGGFARTDVLQLVRDGLRTRTAIDVVEADKETRRARIAGGTSEELARVRGRLRILDDYLALVAELEELTSSSRQPAAGSRQDHELSQLGSLFRVETEDDLAAVARLDDVVSLIASLKGATPQDAIDAIEQAMLSRQTAPDDRPIIWAGELLRFRGRAFTHLFVVRMQDEVFPQRRTEDPLLPDSDRRLLGIREIGDGRDEEQLLFSLLADSTSGSVHFSYASGDGFGKVLRASRFVRTVVPSERHVAEDGRVTPPLIRPSGTFSPRGGEKGLDAHSLRVPFSPPRGEKVPKADEGSVIPSEVEGSPNSRVAGDPSTSLGVTARQLQLIVKSGTRSAFDGYVPGIDPAKLRLSPTQLEDFGECPQKFLLKYILNVRDIDDPERELQIHHRDKGSLDHRILERFYRSMSDDDYEAAHEWLPRLPQPLAERLDGFVDEQFDAHAREFPPFNRTIRDIERRATKRNLREFLVADLADLRTLELVPKYFEYRFGAKHREKADDPEPFVIESRGVPVKVEGTIDRIDTGIEAWRIVDYKSGKALRHANLGDKIDRGVRLQLALYAMAAAKMFGAAAENVSATIKPLVIGETKPAKFAFALHEKQAVLLETLDIFIQAILHGQFPAFPNETDEFNSCKYCPVNHSCRTKHDLEERYAVQQHKDPRTLLGARE